MEWQVEGKITIRLAGGKDEETWQLSVGCSIPGKWVLHWGVNYVGDTGRFVILLLVNITLIVSIFKTRMKLLKRTDKKKRKSSLALHYFVH